MGTITDRRRRWRDRSRAIRSAARLEGFCGTCTIREARTGYKTCERCRSKTARRQPGNQGA